MADPNGLFSELRRRKVFRVAAVYAVVGWALIEFADTTFPRLALPDWTATLVLVLVLLGFPVALILAWALEVTPEGVRREAGQESAGEGEGSEAGSSPAVGQRRGAGWTASRIAVVGAVAVLAIAGGAFVATRGGEPELEDDRVVVLPFEDHSGREELATFGRMAAEWLTEGLVRAELGQVVPTQATYAVLEDAAAHRGGSGMSPARGLALETGAEYVVTGAYYCRGNVLEVQAQVIDGRTGQVLDAVEAVRTPADDPMAALVEVRERVLGLVAARTEPLFDDRGFGYWARPPSYEAYQHFVECGRLYVKNEYRMAIEECSLAADSTFVEPYMWMAPAFTNLGQPALEDSILDIVRSRRAELSRTSQAWLDHHEARLRGDWLTVAKSARELAATYGWWFYGYGVGWAYTRANRPQAAVEAFERVDPTRAGMRDWVAYYVVYGLALHMLGEHDRELALARRAREQHPTRLRPLVSEAVALAALGRIEEAEAVVEEMMAIPGNGPPTWEFRRIGEALLAYGHPEVAERVFRRGIRHLEAVLGPEAVSNSAYADLVLRAGDLDRARELFGRIVEEAAPGSSVRLNALAHFGVAAALQGDEATARAMEAEIAALDRPYDRGATPYVRSNIMAVLGEQERAVELLRQAFSEGYAYSAYLRIDPDLANLRGYPPFEELIRPKG